MSNLGHLGLEWERKREEKRKLIGKDDILRGAASTGKFIQSLVPTTPEEMGQELVDMYSSARIAKGNPWGIAAVHTGKKLIQNSPEVAKAVKVATDVASPYIKKGKEFLEKDWFENLPGYQGRQLATAGGTDSLKIPSNPQQALQPLAIRGQGTSKQLLDIEAQNAAEALKAKNAKNTSTISSVTSDPSDLQIYGKNTKAIKADIPKELGGKLGTLTQIKGVPNKNFHHIFMKDLSSEYVKQARLLVRMGKATPDDVIMLDRIAKKHGFGLGNYKTAGDYVDRVPHNLGHKAAIESGIQPGPSGPGPTLTGEKIKISKFTDMKNLLKDFEDSIVNIAKPMREEILDFQEAWDRIPPGDRGKLIELRLERKAARLKYQTTKAGTKVKKAQHPELVKAEEAYSKLKSKLKKEAINIKDNLKEKRLQIKETKADTKQRKLMDSIPEEMWYSKGR